MINRRETIPFPPLLVAVDALKPSGARIKTHMIMREWHR